MIKISLFTKARIKLTLYYVLIFLTLGSIISGLFYFRTSEVLESEYARMEQRLQLEIGGIYPPGRMVIRRIQPEDLDIARHRIILQLLSINAVILVVVAFAGYFLSGQTLAPIEASMQQQKRFMSDIAHEIKTPLTALKTSLEVNLMDKKLAKHIKTLLQENLQDVSHLDELTTSMLKLSRNQDQPLDASPVSVGDIIIQAIRLVGPAAAAKKIKIDNQNLVQTSITGDKAALTDVIKILLDNAVKYSPENTAITVSSRIHRKSLNIVVSDQGYGISKVDIPHVFDRFYQADSARTKDTAEGYGLGLSIAKTIVEYHNGTIAVTSKINHGTTFTVTLPLNSQ